MVIPDCPSDVAEHAEEHAEHEDEPELGFVYTAVPFGDPDDTPIVERAGDGHGEHDADDPAEVSQALVEDRT